MVLLLSWNLTALSTTVNRIHENSNPLQAITAAMMILATIAARESDNRSILWLQCAIICQSPQSRHYMLARTKQVVNPNLINVPI
jgi:hypothetical protein